VNPSQATYKVLRLKVSGFKNVSEPILLNPSTYGGLWASFNQVPGQSGEFIYTGHQGPIMLTDVNGTVSYSISTSSIPVNQGSDARVIIFNQERYLVMTEAPGAGVLKIYDITKGATTTEALQIFEAGTKIPLLSNTQNGNIASGTAVGITGWAKNGDDTLYLMAAGSGAGFSVLELPKKTLDD
jgi:WD40 repeat protein